MNKQSNIKVTLSISPKMHKKLLAQSEALDTTVNILLKQSALSTLNKTEITFLTAEQRLVIQNFTIHQIRISQVLQQINEQLRSNPNAYKVETLVGYMKDYHTQFIKLVENLKSSS
jgi:hypothetical protein